METNKEPSEVDVMETRIALAFFGGVALAVYESGVALEFFRLVKGEGVYAQLKSMAYVRSVGSVAVDIITGTSAGGLNGAFLANAIVNRGDIGKLLTLWREEGDLDKLLYGPFKSKPESLLDGDRFRKVIFEALIAKRPAPPEEAALQTWLDLYLTATNLDGDRVVITTPDHEEIPTRTHRQVFRFRYRKKEPGSEEQETNDFRTEEDLCLLAQAARASASFPFAFTPVLVEKSGLGRRAQHFEADAYHIDGGVLDNKPIDLALRAIAKRRANKQVRRFLFYIEPDPERIDARVCQIGARPYSAPEVVLKALVGLPGYQSITTALQDIEQHNRDVEDLQRTLKYYEEIAAKYKEGEKEPKPITYFEPEDAATALFRAQEDGYLALRFQREFPPDFSKLFTEVVDKARDTVNLLAPKDEEVARRIGVKFREEVYWLKIRVLGLDLKYHRRLYRYLIQIVRRLYPEPFLGTGGGTGVDLRFIQAAPPRLNRLKKFLYDQDELIKGQERAQADAWEAELADIKTKLRELSEKLGVVQSYEDAIGLITALAKDLKESEFLVRRRQFLERIRGTVAQRLENEQKELLAKWKDLKSELKEERSFEQIIREGYWALRDALESFSLRDMIIYPMMSSDELAAELETIHFARISPADADQFLPGLSSKEKIAGEQFAHFGGFFSEAWRGNDLTWGRLDAAEIIFRKLLPDGQERRELIEKAHDEIIKEMSRLGMGIFVPPQPGAAPIPVRERQRQDLIGKQDLAAIPADKKINWSWRGAITVLKIGHQTLSQSKAAFLLKRLVNILDWVIFAMTGLFVLFFWVGAKLFRGRVLRWLVLGAALIGLGVLLHLAWEHPLHALWNGFWERLMGIFHTVPNPGQRL